MALEVVLFVAVAVLFVVVECAAIAGLLLALGGGRLEPCSRCHRFWATVDGEIHEHVCRQRIKVLLVRMQGGIRIRTFARSTQPVARREVLVEPAPQ